ncbi:hypothetical protein M9Y10_011799 [Tritrichomonas musculus]|uniref:Protein kinase domain-containing protein n=1 Tax=Tritrichomonas musculus TaxID=1915356 RepID=A0ABR2ILQ5_9EUKA
MNDQFLDNVYKDSHLYLITKEDEELKTNQIRNESNVMIFDKIYVQDEEYNIICFDHVIILLSNTYFIPFLNSFFNNFKDPKVISISNELTEILRMYEKVDEFESNEIIELYDDIMKENHFFNNFLVKNPTDKEIKDIWIDLRRSILCFILKKSFLKINKDRINNYNFIEQPVKTKEIDLHYNKFIKIKKLGNKNSIVYLIYHFELEELFALKVFSINQNKELFEREKRNYLSIHHPLIPKFYVTTKNSRDNCLLSEYIKGESLENIEKLHLNKDDKIRIIFEILVTIEYLHNKGFIYRDLKPDNFMIDENKTVVLIDFDRMISTSDEQKTKSFQSDYIAPEVLEKDSHYSFEADIYSLGFIIYFIIMEKNPKVYDGTIFNEFPVAFNELINVCENCVKVNPKERPNITSIIDKVFDYSPTINSKHITDINVKKTIKDIYNDPLFPYWMLIDEYNDSFFQKVIGITFNDDEYDISQDRKKLIFYTCLSADKNHQRSRTFIGMLFYVGQEIHRDINKMFHYLTLSADKNNEIGAQYVLGIIYSTGQIIAPNINKAIHYLTLAANQNFQQAQATLGDIYYEGKYNIPKDINKAIYYLTLAANQNDADSQFSLGIFYIYDCVPNDINKGIYYLTLSADNNFSRAQFNLALLYDNDEYLQHDMKKAIHYYTLAANNNNVMAQVNLGNIYFYAKNVPRDMKKAIFYLTLASNQDEPKAHFLLGEIFFFGKYVPQDIKKGIHYYTLAADHGDGRAQYVVGLYYLNIINNSPPIDINKAIHYLTLSSNQGLYQAYFTLGYAYYNGYIKRDINKAIHYFTLAANCNLVEAYYFLGLIFYKDPEVPRDINKSIHFFSLAAGHNDPNAQFYLGLIYCIEKNKLDIKKGIHYLTLSANQNNADAQLLLGIIYLNNECTPRDINKGIHYLSLASSNNNAIAQYFLGCINFTGEFHRQNIPKGIHYLTLAANKNNANAQFVLGFAYYHGRVEKNIKKAIYYFSLAAKKRHIPANFSMAIIHHQGIYVQRNIDEAIRYYKEGSSFNHQYSKNNLGIIYKDKSFNRNPIVYFEEAIRQKNDVVAIYNLAHIYFYGEAETNENLDKSIDLLLRSSDDFGPSMALLCLAIVKKIKHININEIREILKNKSRKFIQEIWNVIRNENLQNEIIYNKFYLKFKKFDICYNISKNPVLTKDFLYGKKNDKNEYKHIQTINKLFFEGFGIDY